MHGRGTIMHLHQLSTSPWPERDVASYLDFVVRSGCSGTPVVTGISLLHWLPPLHPLEVLPHTSAKETKVARYGKSIGSLD